MVKAIKNNSVLSVLILVGIVVIALAQFTTAIQSLQAFLGPKPSKGLTAEYCNLVAPLIAQLDRTKGAIRNRWTPGNVALELTVRDANLEARKLLTDRAGLTTPDLEDHRKKLVDHYDEWHEEFILNREQTESGSQAPYTFVHSFPQDSEAAFRARYDALRDKLGASIACGQ